jgi:hypothetical protein
VQNRVVLCLEGDLGVNLFICCGVKYSKIDPETYWCIETDLIKNYAFTKKDVNSVKIYKEIVETLVCKKHGCIQVHIKRYGKLRGRYKILEIEKLSGNEAAQFIIETEKIRIRQPQICPFKTVPFVKNLDLCYGKTITPVQQRRRYANDKDWSNKFEAEKGWQPDIIDSQVENKCF